MHYTKRTRRFAHQLPVAINLALGKLEIEPRLDYRTDAQQLISPRRTQVRGLQLGGQHIAVYRSHGISRKARHGIGERR